MKETPEFLKPRLRLFLSADVVGSTGLKQSRLGSTPSEIQQQHALWFSTIQGFYIEAQQKLQDQWKSACETWPGEQVCYGDPPQLWKTIGDEVLFSKIITDYRQVASTIRCWIDVIAHLKEFVQGKNSRLDLKSTAWLAGFPVENKEVVVSSHDMNVQVDDYYKESGRILNEYYSGKRNEISIDFIGPAIDIGFRLSAYSSPRKLIVSAAIPYILSLTNPTEDGRLPDFSIYFDESVPLKGVLGGLLYPVFWIDLSDTDDLSRYEDALTGSTRAGRDDIRRFCEAFFKTHKSYLFKPFIDDQTEQQLSQRPSWYNELHALLIDNFTRTPADADGGAQVDDEDESLFGPKPSDEQIQEATLNIGEDLKIQNLEGQPGDGKT